MQGSLRKGFGHLSPLVIYMYMIKELLPSPSPLLLVDHNSFALSMMFFVVVVFLPLALRLALYRRPLT